jgi:predicted Zn finger-like uncharacterized protein
MSLATRCTACGTIFRIVEDQLRVSDGWVRCGRCAEVFDARELLFDIERDAPPSWPMPFTATAPPEPMPVPPPPAPPPPLPPPPPPPPPPAPPPAAPVFEEPVWTQEAPPGHEIITAAPWTDEPARQEPRWVDDFPSAAAPLTEPEPLVKASAIAAAAATAEMPEFMRRAESGERWRRPGVRWALGGVSVLLLLTLALQVLLHFRDALAALHPPARGPLAALCHVAGCELQAWRRIEALSIDATALNPVGNAGNSYRLSLSLRNKTAVDVAAPWVELSLTDASGAAFARRVFGPEALTPALQQVGAESEHALSLNFSTGSQRVSGYSVNIFYP